MVNSASISVSDAKAHVQQIRIIKWLCWYVVQRSRSMKKFQWNMERQWHVELVSLQASIVGVQFGDRLLWNTQQ